MSTIPAPELSPEMTVPADLVFLREPEVVTVLKEIAHTQARILALLEDITTRRRIVAKERF